MVLIGVAFGLGFPALSLAATAGIPDEEQGLAASLFQTSFQVGGAIVLAIVTAVVEAGGASQIKTPQATLGAYRPALAVITAISALGALTALSGLLPARHPALRHRNRARRRARSRLGASAEPGCSRGCGRRCGGRRWRL